MSPRKAQRACKGNRPEKNMPLGCPRIDGRAVSEPSMPTRQQDAQNGTQAPPRPQAAFADTFLFMICVLRRLGTLLQPCWQEAGSAFRLQRTAAFALPFLLIICIRKRTAPASLKTATKTPGSDEAGRSQNMRQIWRTFRPL